MNWVIIASGNDLLPVRSQSFAQPLLYVLQVYPHFRWYFDENISISFKKMHLENRLQNVDHFVRALYFNLNFIYVSFCLKYRKAPRVDLNRLITVYPKLPLVIIRDLSCLIIPLHIYGKPTTTGLHM